MHSRSGRWGAGVQRLVGMVCVLMLIPGDMMAYRQTASTQQTSTAPQPQQQSATIPADQLDSLVAPIALYPDPMLAQVLAASTYPLEIVQLEQWLAKNPTLKDKALADAVAKQPWDPSVQALAGLPDVVKRLADDIEWTTDLGNAFLAQQSDVMDAVQRMRAKAQGTGNLKSTQQQNVETKSVDNKSVIVIEQANPQVVYVPSYNPTVVYGPPVYPYPPIYYPPPGYYAAGLAISFGVGIAMGAFWSGGWGWGCGWGGHNNITINNYNNFNRNTNINNRINGGGNRPGGGGSGTWQHNPQHRGGTPYGDRATANRFGGTTAGSSLANRQTNARQQIGREGGNLSSNHEGGAGMNNRGSLGAGGAGERGGGMGSGNRGGDFGGNRGGAEHVGSRDLSRGGGGSPSTFGGGRGGFNGASARSMSSRGSFSMGGRGGGGGRRR
ncbi:MAG TPA: DUF3300 domain-containing protein [Edaphobacter sp.]|jgi:hypothetical protein|nr:DUF3300 domain-containing protein [Edaphobacter sp.]